jgi:uncharacterized protein YxjI
MSGQKDAFLHDRYLFRRKVLKVFGGEFRIYDSNGNLALFSKQKAFKLKEDIRAYADESMTNELLTMKARQIVDFGATYDVEDAQQDVKVGSIRRKGLKSMIRDEWLLFDPQGQQIGVIQEERAILALIRRFVPLANLIPQRYNIRIGGQPVASLKQHFDPFVLKYTLDLSRDYEKRLDRRLAIAAGILFCAIERRQ